MSWFADIPIPPVLRVFAETDVFPRAIPEALPWHIRKKLRPGQSIISIPGPDCAYCGIETWYYKKRGKDDSIHPILNPAMPDAHTRDHVIPKSKGGTGAGNKVDCCLKCNADKGNLTGDEYRAILRGRATAG